jgi:hypothetical protein
MTSYRDRPNDLLSVEAYVRDRFGAMHQSTAPPTPNNECGLHGEGSVCGREDSKKVLIGSPYDGGD